MMPSTIATRPRNAKNQPTNGIHEPSSATMPTTSAPIARPLPGPAGALLGVVAVAGLRVAALLAVLALRLAVALLRAVGGGGAGGRVLALVGLLAVLARWSAGWPYWPWSACWP